MLRIMANGKDYDWHVGEPLPPLRGGVVAFQADGHELWYMLAVMRAHQEEAYAISVLGHVPHTLSSGETL